MSDLILNNIRHKTCPLCSSDTISYVGMLNYSPNISFSTHEISLAYKPELWICKNCESQFIQNTIPVNNAVTHMGTPAVSFSGAKWLLIRLP